MNKARAFFFVCAGIFLLALSFHLGAVTATAQAPSNPVVGTLDRSGTNLNGAVVTANGDIYATSFDSGLTSGWHFVANVFGGPTPATQATWGQIKSHYRQGATMQDKNDK